MMKIFASKVVNFNDGQYQYYVQSLSPKRRVIINNYKQHEDACRALTSVLLLKQIIKDHLGVEFSDSIVDYNNYGKAFLPDFPFFHFNISHSGQWVVCAIDETPIGIDIEQVQPIDYIGIARDCFCIEEYHELLSKSGSELGNYFYSLWTAKESYIKALGKGLSVPLDSFAIKIKENRVCVKAKNPHSGNRKMFFKQYDVINNYKLTVCAEHFCFPEEILLKRIT